MKPSLFFGLLRRRECLLPTWRGWLALVALLTIFAFVAVKQAYPFLATHETATSGVLVAEGWIPDYAMTEALEEFRRNHYDGLFVTGIPLEMGDLLHEHKTLAELGAATLLKLGADPATLHAVPTPNVRQDRTYTSAVVLKRWLEQHGMAMQSVNVITLGPHARRTKLLYEKAFGPATHIGVVPIEDHAFDPHRWWTSSQGFRVVTDEAIAYIYARLFFRPKESQLLPEG